MGDYVWFNEMWGDTLDSCITYIDSVYKGTDKLGPGMKSSVVWLVENDTSDTACNRMYDDPEVHFFQVDPNIYKLYRWRFFNWDTLRDSLIVRPTEGYSLCAAIIINGEFIRRWGLKVRMPLAPDSSTLSLIPDEVEYGDTVNLYWSPIPQANTYMVRLIEGDNQVGYSCYYEILLDTPLLSLTVPEVVPETEEGWCDLRFADSFRIEVANTHRLVYDDGDMFGETRSTARLVKWVKIRR